MAGTSESIRGKVVVITGASSGIGESIARRLGSGGAKVALGARRVDRLGRIVEEIETSGGQAIGVEVDVTRRDRVKALVDSAVERFGRIDVMINNAGVMPLSKLEADRVDEWDRTIDVNIKGVLYGISAALPRFRAQGSGHLICVSSVAGQVIFPGAAVYCGTKFAVRAIAEAFRMEVGSTIRSTIISPGAVQSELRESTIDPAAKESMKDFDQLAIPADAIARAVQFAIEQPADVDVNEILVRPTAQTY